MITSDNRRFIVWLPAFFIQFLLLISAVFLFLLPSEASAASDIKECIACHKDYYEKFAKTKMGKLFLNNPQDELQKSVCKACHGPSPRHDCAYCHGTDGKGKGAATAHARHSGAGGMAFYPADFTMGVYKFRSTPSGYLPTDEDIFRTITKGVPGLMPSYAGLPPQERWQLVYYVKSFYPDFAEEDEEELELIEIGNPIPSSTASIRKGEEFYQELKCWECHGAGGKGDGKKAAELKDDFGRKILAANLTKLSSLKNGSSKKDIYRTIMTGFAGTPMASYYDSIEDEDDAWHMVNYILSLSGNNQ
ncbi:MAG: c-type cytochrome [Nitrospinota bacterium]